MPPKKRARVPTGRDERRRKEKQQQGQSKESWRFRGESIQLTRQLVEIHGKPERTSDPLNEYNITQGHHQSSVLDSLVRTILSQNTTDKTSIRAFASLKEKFPDWDAVRTADVEDVAESIRVGGLADSKAAWIQTILDTLHSEHGACTLEWLRTKSTDQIKQYLLAFKGVGPKTISCTLLFALDRADFPVDTHVNRIAADLGWVAKSSSREATYEHLNEMLDDDIKYDLHITLVEHGKTCSYCSTRSGSMAAESCPVRAIKASRRKGVGAASVAKVEVKSEDEAWVKEED